MEKGGQNSSSLSTHLSDYLFKRDFFFEPRLVFSNLTDIGIYFRTGVSQDSFLRFTLSIIVLALGLFIG